MYYGCVIDPESLKVEIYLSRISLILNTNIQPWCSTELDHNGIGLKWANCGPDCPMHHSALKTFTTDDTLVVTYHYNQNEIMMTLKLYGIMAVSLLLIGLMITGLGIHSEKYYGISITLISV